jgi:hypothetical protein
VCNRDCWPDIERYIRDVVRQFRDDKRVLLWDLYNEPGNRGIFATGTEEVLYDEKLETCAHELMKLAFRWVREEDPAQPLTVCAWRLPAEEEGETFYQHPLDQTALALSDVVSYHAYTNTGRMTAIIQQLQALGRPIFCTEWLARHVGGTIEEQLPLMYMAKVAPYQWGLVRGKTQTWLPWPVVMKTSTDYCRLWFHDVFEENGIPFSRAEITLLQKLRKIAPKVQG